MGGTCSVSKISSLAIHRRNLRSLVFIRVPKLLGLLPSVCPTKFLKEDIHGPPMEVAVVELPVLPQDVLMSIFAHLEIPDLMRASSVSSSWRSAYSSLRNLEQYQQRQTPCLLYTSESAGERVACLYSLLEKRSYKLTLPEPPIRSRYLIGSSNGWLVTADERSEMHILNPITCEQIALPSVITIAHVTPVFDETGALCKCIYSHDTAEHRSTTGPQLVDLGELRHYLRKKAFVFYDASAGGYIVVLIHNPDGQLSFAWLGDDKWTWLKPHCFFQDCLYKDGKLYVVTLLGEIHVFDLRGPVVTTKVIRGCADNYSCRTIYIVQAPCGDLMQVFRSQDVVDYDPRADNATHVHYTDRIKIFKVETMAEKVMEINSLMDHVLLVGLNQSLCLSAEEFPQLKANTVYIADDHEYLNYYKNNRRDIAAFDLTYNSSEELVSPQLWSNWPTPIWITPSLTKPHLTLDRQ
ncbi:LOW QUALITY PROTEIN: F-box protein KIB4 [Triticum dicoccoides]|uniref:LOW QUALITY PROTEIN: F-box protein KIB4 n=1 Tax=Triticum dicoccoides TaxID=85692 RepID=UPI00188EEB86|nr:LOW QUALITY PROTEIN: F-box protein KIB4 [Triticum dicoccoides]